MRSTTAIAALIALTAGMAGAESLLDRAKRDEIAHVAKDDAEMAAAMRRARETLPEFLKLAAAPRPTTRGFAIKVAVSEADDTEFFWITRFERRNDEFTGRINNTPRLVKKVRFGQAITFKEEEIVDWLYQDAGAMRGNFTACVLLKREPPAEAEKFMKQLGLRCDP